MVADLFGLKEFTWEFIKTLIVGGTLTSIPIYKILSKDKDKNFSGLMRELKLENSKGQVPVVIDTQEVEYGKNYVLHVPDGLCEEDLIKKSSELKHSLNGDIQTQYIGEHRVLMKVISNELEKMYKYEYEKLPLMKFAIGYSYYGREYLELNNEDVSILHGGGTGKGKSSFLDLLITQMILNNHNMIDLYLCDLARKELCIFEDCKYVKGVAYEEKETLEILYKLERILENRSKEFGNGINDIYKYNKKNPNKPWKHIVCVIDEFADITLTADKKQSLKTQLLLSKLERKGRSVGMHFILSTQHPNAETVPAIVKKHLLVRIAFPVSDKFASDAILDYSGAENLSAVGRAIIKNSECNCKEFQALFIDSDEVIEMIKHTFINKEVVENVEPLGVKRNGNSKNR